MESVKNAISEALDLKIFWGRMPPNLPKNLLLWYSFSRPPPPPPPHPQLEICSAVPEYTVKLKKKGKKPTSVSVIVPTISDIISRIPE